MPRGLAATDADLNDGLWLDEAVLRSSFPAADRRARLRAMEFLLLRVCRDLSIPISSTPSGTRNPTDFFMTNSPRNASAATHPERESMKITFAASSFPPQPYSTAAQVASITGTWGHEEGNTRQAALGQMAHMQEEAIGNLRPQRSGSPARCRHGPRMDFQYQIMPTLVQ